MRRREAAEPLLVVCDEASGMIRAIDAHRASALPLSQGAQPAKQGNRRPLALSSKPVPFGCCQACLSGASVKDSHSSSFLWIPAAQAEPWAALSPLQQCA